MNYCNISKKVTKKFIKMIIASLFITGSAYAKNHLGALTLNSEIDEPFNGTIIVKSEKNEWGLEPVHVKLGSIVEFYRYRLEPSQYVVDLAFNVTEQTEEGFVITVTSDKPIRSKHLSFVVKVYADKEKSYGVYEFSTPEAGIIAEKKLTTCNRFDWDKKGPCMQASLKNSVKETVFASSFKNINNKKETVTKPSPYGDPLKKVEAKLYSEIKLYETTKTTKTEERNIKNKDIDVSEKKLKPEKKKLDIKTKDTFDFNSSKKVMAEKQKKPNATVSNLRQLRTKIKARQINDQIKPLIIIATKKNKKINEKNTTNDKNISKKTPKTFVIKEKEWVLKSTIKNKTKSVKKQKIATVTNQYSLGKASWASLKSDLQKRAPLLKYKKVKTNKTVSNENSVVSSTKKKHKKEYIYDRPAEVSKLFVVNDDN